MHNKSLQHKYYLLERKRNGFEKMASVTGKQVRPLILLQKRGRVLCEANTRNASFIILKVSKPFPGSWKMDNRE
jgi:hypothetical protein